MLDGLIAVAIGWGLAALLKKFIFKGQPIGWLLAAAIGFPILIVLLAIGSQTSGGTEAVFGPIVVGIIIMTLTQGYTRQSKKVEHSIEKVSEKTVSVVSADSAKKKPAPKPAVEKPAAKPAPTEPVKKEKHKMSSAHDDEKFYEQVAAELEGGNRRQGLWLKAETKAEGDADKTRWLYIGWRVEQLAEEEREAQRLKEEEERLKEEEEQRQRDALRLAEEERLRQLAEEERLRQLAEEEQRQRDAPRLAKEEERQRKEKREKPMQDGALAISPITQYGYRFSVAYEKEGCLVRGTIGVASEDTQCACGEFQHN